MRPEMFRCLRCRYVYVIHDDQTPQVCDVCHGERFVRIIVGHPVERPAPVRAAGLAEAAVSA